MDYKNKYLKYKEKYLEYKTKISFCKEIDEAITLLKADKNYPTTDKNDKGFFKVKTYNDYIQKYITKLKAKKLESIDINNNLQSYKFKDDLPKQSEYNKNVLLQNNIQNRIDKLENLIILLEKHCKEGDMYNKEKWCGETLVKLRS